MLFAVLPLAPGILSCFLLKISITSALPELVDQGIDTAINRTNKILRAWPNWNKATIEDRQLLLYELSEMIWGIAKTGK